MGKRGGNAARLATYLALLVLLAELPAAFAAIELVWGGPTSGGGNTPCGTTAGNGQDSCTPTNAYAPGYDQGLGVSNQLSAGTFDMEAYDSPGGAFPTYDDNYSLQYGPSTAGGGSYDPAGASEREADWQCITDENKTGIGPRLALVNAGSLGGGGSPCPPPGANMGLPAETALTCTPPPTGGCGCASNTPTSGTHMERLECPNPNLPPTCGPCGNCNNAIACGERWSSILPCRFVNHPRATDMRWYSQANNLAACYSNAPTQDFVDDWNVNAIYHSIDVNTTNCIVPGGTQAATDLVGMDINGQYPYCVPQASFTPDVNQFIDVNIMSNVQPARQIDNNFGLFYSVGAVGKWDSGYGDHNVDVGVRRGRLMSFVPNASPEFRNGKCMAMPMPAPYNRLGNRDWNALWEIMQIRDGVTGTAGTYTWIGNGINQAGLLAPTGDTNYIGDDIPPANLNGGIPYKGSFIVKPCRWVNHPRTTDIQLEDLNVSTDVGLNGGAMRMYPLDWIDDWNAAVLYSSVNVSWFNSPGTCPTSLVGRVGDGNNTMCNPDVNFTINKFSGSSRRTDTNFVVTLQLMSNVTVALTNPILIEPGVSMSDPPSSDVPDNNASLIVGVAPTGVGGPNCATPGDLHFALLDVNQNTIPGNTCTVTQVNDPPPRWLASCTGGTMTGGTTYTLSLVMGACAPTLSGNWSSYYWDLDFNLSAGALTPQITPTWPTDFINGWGCTPACTTDSQCNDNIISTVDTCTIAPVGSCNNECANTADTAVPDVNILLPTGGDHYLKGDGNILVKFTVRDTRSTGEELFADLFSSLNPLDFNATGQFGDDVNLAQIARNPTVDANCSVAGGTSYASAPNTFFDQNVLCFYDWNPSGLADQNYFVDINVFDLAKNVGVDSTPKQHTGTEARLLSAWNFNDPLGQGKEYDINTTGARDFSTGGSGVTSSWTSPVEGYDLNFDNTNDYLISPTGTLKDLNITQAFTLEAFLNLSDWNATRFQLLVAFGPSSSSLVYMMAYLYPKLFFKFTNDTGAHGSSCLSLDMGPDLGYANPYYIYGWRHLAMTFSSDTNTLNCYLNGRLIRSGVLGGGPLQQYPGSYAFVGSLAGDTNTWLNGHLDSPAIYNGVIAKRAIKQRAGAVLVNTTNTPPTVTAVTPTGSGESCTTPGPYLINWTSDDGDLDDLNFAVYYDTVSGGKSNQIIGNLSQATAACEPSDTNCLYSWDCSVATGNYYLTVTAFDGRTTTDGTSANTLNIIPEYEELTLLLAVVASMALFVAMRRNSLAGLE